MLFQNCGNDFCSKSNCITLPYFATGIICTLMLTIIVALIITMLFFKRYEVQKRKKEAVNLIEKSRSIVMAQDSTPQMNKEPIYDDIELTDKTSAINLSKNVAYACSKNKSH